MVVSGIEDTQPQILSRRGMAVIVLGLVAYLEWFGLHGDWRRWQGECEEDEEEEEAAIAEQRWKGKINNEIGWPRETWIHFNEATFIGSNCLKIHFEFEFKWQRGEKRSIKNINICIKSQLFPLIINLLFSLFLIILNDCNWYYYNIM